LGEETNLTFLKVLNFVRKYTRNLKRRVGEGRGTELTYQTNDFGI